MSSIVPQCEGCALANVEKRKCTAFVDPAYQHRGGRKCWGRCDSAREMVARLEAMVSYNDHAGTNTATVAELRRELRGWEETVRVMEGGETA